jgi:hypothetical protein
MMKKVLENPSSRKIFRDHVARNRDVEMSFQCPCG